MEIVILDGYTVNPGDLSWKGIQALGQCTIYDRTSPDEVVERAAKAEIILTNKTALTAAHIDALPYLRYIGVMATGYDIIDIEAATKHGIMVTNVPAYSTESVAQMVFAHILNITQGVRQHSEEVHKGRWSNSKDFCFWNTPLIELADKNIGIVGFGRTGQATARIALAFGMKVLAYTSKQASALPGGIEKVELDELFQQSDIVSLHCPLNNKTYHIINSARLTLMKSDAVLINTSRGGLVDEQALANALNTGTIRAAGIDVLSQEPPHPDNPLLSARNCHITPHIAWATTEARLRLMSTLEKNIIAYISGTASNMVNSCSL